jgi:hypothetical protein
LVDLNTMFKLVSFFTLLFSWESEAVINTLLSANALARDYDGPYTLLETD